MLIGSMLAALSAERQSVSCADTAPSGGCSKRQLSRSAISGSGGGCREVRRPNARGSVRGATVFQ